MATLKDIKRRIKSVKNTQQITKAMKMVAAAKLRRAQENIEAARPYAVKMRRLVSNIAGTVPEGSHDLLAPATTNKTELILVTSDRGLCGGFNSNLIKRAELFIAENPDKEISMNLIGRRGADYFKRHSSPVRTSMELGPKRPDYAMAKGIARDVTGTFTGSDTSEVYLIFSEFISVLTQKPALQKLLPISAETGEEEAGNEDAAPDTAKTGVFTFEPSEEEVLDELLPKYVEVQILRAVLESAASEHGARMTSMDAASKSAAEMISSLTLIYNRVRQAAITTELMEIIAGAESLKG